MELGASLHNPFCLPNCPNIAPSDGVRSLYPRDLDDYKVYVDAQKKIGFPPTKVDKIGDFRNIPAESESLDFIISSHVIEHEPNPIAAFLESARVLKEGGIFFCVFPKRTAERIFDIFRPLTRLEELIEAYHQDRTIDKYLISTPSAAENQRPHYYVCSLQSMLQLINWVNRQKLATFCVMAVEETDSKIGNGHTVVLRKMSSASMQDADYTLFIENCIRNKQYEEGLLAARMSLSFDFFQPSILQAAALLALETGNPIEAKEFYRQCLLQDAECESRRREFFEIFGEHYTNPLR
ncbi:MAG: class I SAM-dependent methyltransferase [Azoarcus sp.]|nr:class I SAM-dependent methyltransferase [Azoarcus sp.]